MGPHALQTFGLRSGEPPDSELDGG